MTEEKIELDDDMRAEPEAEEEKAGEPSIDDETISPMQDNVVAETVNIQQGGAQNVTADKVTVTQGGIAHAEGRFIDVTDGGIAAAMGENVTITDGAAVIVAANNVKIVDGIAVFVAANEISGENVKVIIDARAAAFFALVFGAVVGVFKMIMRRRD